MERYDYQEAVRGMVRDYLAEKNVHGYISNVRKARLLEDMGKDDVTGMAVGSYFCSSWTAEECLCHNGDLLEAALSEMEMDDEGDPEFNDVVIREYLLPRCLDEVVKVWNAEHCDEDEEG